MPSIPETTAAELALLCGGRIAGDGARAVRGIRSLERAGPGDLSFASDGKAERRASSSKAGVLLVRAGTVLSGPTLIEVGDPTAALSLLLGVLFPRRTAEPGIHPTAVVAPGADVHAGAEVGPYVVIGAGSRIGAGAIVEAHVTIGRRCRVEESAWLHPQVVLYDDVRVGPRSEVHSGAILGADGFGYAAGSAGFTKVPQVGGVELDADVEIGANSCIDRATLEATRIGAGTKVDDLVMVGHNSEVGRSTLLCGQAGLAGSTVVGDGVVLGGQVGVAGHLRVGNRVKAGAQSGISKDVPDGEEVNGSPHMPYRESMRVLAELRRLPETARLVRKLTEGGGA